MKDDSRKRKKSFFIKIKSSGLHPSAFESSLFSLQISGHTSGYISGIYLLIKTFK